jgi:hypothetical protein
VVDEHSLREQWMREQRTPAHEIPDEYLERHAHLVPESLRTAAHDELWALWRELGKSVRAVRGDRQRFSERDHLRSLRQEIRAVTSGATSSYEKLLRELEWSLKRAPLTKLRGLVAARAAQRVAAWPDYLATVAARPIDDPAWAKEQARRRVAAEERRRRQEAEADTRRAAWARTAHDRGPDLHAVLTFVDDDEDALRRLGLTLFATANDVQRAFRQRAKTAHPDAGGSTRAFQQLVRDRDAAVRAVGSRVRGKRGTG